MRFANKVLFVTGGGSGIGAATARQFASEGGRVAVADIDGERARKIASELDGALALQVDIGDEEAVRTAIETTAREFGRIDCVVNSGGHWETRPLDEWTIEHYRRMVDVHFGGTLFITKHVARFLLAQDGAAIVNVSSIGAAMAIRNVSVYGAAKSAVEGFTRHSALELAPRIRVNCVAPGSTRSGMTEEVYSKRGGGSFEKGAAMAAAPILLKRIASSEEIAAPICFLLSSEASFITGQVLHVDGGQNITKT